MSLKGACSTSHLPASYLSEAAFNLTYLKGLTSTYASNNQINYASLNIEVFLVLLPIIELENLFAGAESSLVKIIEELNEQEKSRG